MTAISITEKHPAAPAFQDEMRAAFFDAANSFRLQGVHPDFVADELMRVAIAIQQLHFGGAATVARLESCAERLRMLPPSAPRAANPNCRNLGRGEHVARR